ncbi:hypothetical protein CRG98_028920 [Punica granatum]|uniref:Reverse transcriptase Ty1/copia-type domain-containing protein n=1 Tax=Punica granatum TaxID=22663 RepID=A0A2I0J3Q4_PUNGR|nr:hypothetical protein CRG98_028920 [Punica granatum]
MNHVFTKRSVQSPSTQKERDRMNRIPYASAIGFIIYAMLCTRSDISYALSMTSRYQFDLGERHWIAVKNIIKYLRRTKEMFLIYGGDEELVSFKQETIANSTTEAEYIAVSNAAKEAVLIKKFVTELVVIPSIADPVNLYCDNNGAIAQAKETGSHQRSKHIFKPRRFHLIREIINRGDVKMYRIPINENLADPLTKSLVQLKHKVHTRSIGIRKMPDWL